MGTAGWLICHLDCLSVHNTVHIHILYIYIYIKGVGIGLQPFNTVYVFLSVYCVCFFLLDPFGSFDVVTEVRGEFRRLKEKVGH